MAKLGFTKFNLKPNNQIQTVMFNEQSIEVKQYLPVEEKLELITNVIELSSDNRGFINPVKINVYTMLEIVDKYTNISFTEKQKENPTKLYDLMNGNGLIAIIIDNIPEKEYCEIVESIKQSAEAIDKYKNSLVGMLDGVSKDYSNIDLDLTNIQNKLTDPEALATLKELASMSGFIEARQ